MHWVHKSGSDCHPLCQCKALLASALLVTKIFHLAIEQVYCWKKGSKPPSCCIAHVTVLPAQETRCGKYGIFLPSACAMLGIWDSNEDRCRWYFGDLTPRQPELGQGRGKETCSTAVSKLRAICSLFLASRAFIHPWYNPSVCFHAYLEKLACIQR